MYESALRRHFTPQDGWIVTRNYPFKVFADGFYTHEPSFPVPSQEEHHLSAADLVSYEELDLSTLPLVVEHVSSPGEPVLILDLHEAQVDSRFDNFSHSMARRNAVLLDIMGWQLNEVERFVKTF
jgi:hypothetical protein